MPRVVVITGAGAGIGRQTARAFARNGDWVGLIGRDEARLRAAADELRAMGTRAAVAPADVAEAAQMEAAAETIEAELGPIDIWVNNAMATVFAPVMEVTPEEFLRATQVTYLGTVNGTQAALRRMRARNAGHLINVGSALAYRSVPLQSVYCGAKSAIRGFTDSLRCELLHDGVDVQVTMVHMPALNTPQFDWARNKTGRKARPVPPVYAPEVAARAILFASKSKRREIWVGFPTVKAILANRFAAGLADRILAKSAYPGQLLNEPKPADAPDNLFAPVPGEQAARGHFGAEERSKSPALFVAEHKVAAAALAGLALFGLHRLARRLDI